ncbi:MAG TPA: FtsQ-type POTRA domain-containing protein [Thermoanaerobaculia bacterium]|jgi:cell division protein FtsQ|nr:FtsQ-type POTRA domain-containing protein [Thermoanaerobaculia bacterium]
MSFDTTASRFLRPTDLHRLRRNQRRIQVHRLLVILRNCALAAVAFIGVAWAWRYIQSSAFAVQTIEVVGAKHTPKEVLDRATQRYVGANLFQIDIDRVQRDLGGRGWVDRIDIEKKLPDALRIKITERTPVALVRRNERLLYVDAEGAAFAELSPRVGDNDLPLIADAHGPELTRSVQLLTALEQRDRELYSRISEVWPIPPHGFALFDRELNAVVYVNAEDISTKYRNLYAVLRAENNPKIQYADLRFADRVIVKGLETNNVQN